jgi:hypothetical protein
VAVLLAVAVAIREDCPIGLVAFGRDTATANTQTSMEGEREINI